MIVVRDLGLMEYRRAWAVQERANADVFAGAGEQLLLVEHPPVITFGRRAETLGQKNLIATRDELAQRRVDVVQSDRGGDVTFHGPGQVVAYPIVRLIDHQLSVGCYVRTLELAVIAALEQFGIAAQKDPREIGVWAPDDRGTLAKICALGVRIRRGVSMHGVALNVETDLSYFDLIVPCGLAGRSVTSMRTLLRDRTPTIADVKDVLAQHLVRSLGRSKPDLPACTRA
jgi:lipoyl(octanoyl) transferase